MESPVSGIVADTQLPGISLFVHLASGPVVVGYDLGPLVLGNPVDQTESLFPIFRAARHLPRLFERDAKAVVSHREIRIDCGGALKQRKTGWKMALAHLGKTCGVVLKSFHLNYAHNQRPALVPLG